MINPDALNLSGTDAESFREDGFLIVENVLDTDSVDALRATFPRIFAGDFDTGVYLDEWHWREGMSLPDATRHMGNAWKSDLTIAKLVLSSDIAGAAAELAGHFDHYVCRNYTGTRGRGADEIPGLLKAGLRQAGVAESAITVIPDATEAIDFCLQMAADGDLLVLLPGNNEFESTWEKLRALG